MLLSMPKAFIYYLQFVGLLSCSPLTSACEDVNYVHHRKNIVPIANNYIHQFLRCYMNALTVVLAEKLQVQPLSLLLYATTLIVFHVHN